MIIWPQITLIVLISIGFAIHLVKWGEPSGTYNPVTNLISIAITLALLHAGGFFVPIGW